MRKRRRVGLAGAVQNPTGFGVLGRRGGAAKGPGNWLAHEAGCGWQTQELVQVKNKGRYRLTDVHGEVVKGILA